MDNTRYSKQTDNWKKGNAEITNYPMTFIYGIDDKQTCAILDISLYHLEICLLLFYQFYAEKPP